MDGPNNLLELARSIGPYQTMSSVSNLVSTTAPQDSRRTLNGWNYNGEPAQVVSPGGCNFSPYSPGSLGSGTGTAGLVGSPHKPTYTGFTSSADLVPNCQQMQLNQITQLNSFPPHRNFSFYGDVYQPHQTGMTGGGLFSDLTTIPSIPRYESDVNTPYMTDPNNQSSGKIPLQLIPLFTFALLASAYVNRSARVCWPFHRRRKTATGGPSDFIGRPSLLFVRPGLIDK